jgi:hypothetical protein
MSYPAGVPEDLSHDSRFNISFRFDIITDKCDMIFFKGNDNNLIGRYHMHNQGGLAN